MLLARSDHLASVPDRVSVGPKTVVLLRTRPSSARAVWNLRAFAVRRVRPPAPASTRWRERGQPVVDGAAHAIEGCGIGAGDELHVPEDHERVELEGNLRRVGAGIELVGCLPGRHLLGEQPEPALAEGHGAVPDGAWMGVELANRGNEETPARK